MCVCFKGVPDEESTGSYHLSNYLLTEQRPSLQYEPQYLGIKQFTFFIFPFLVFWGV